MSRLDGKEQDFGLYDGKVIDLDDPLRLRRVRVEIPGMGRLSWDALTGRDYAVFMALLALTSVMQLVGNLLSDFCYLLIDPRIHFGKT